VRSVWLASLAACGRIGFGTYGGGSGDPFGDGGVVPPDTIALEVTADGAPGAIAGATVLVDRGGTYDRLTTDGQGIATIDASAATTLDVVYRVGSSWRVYTLIDVPPQTAIVLGGRRPNESNTSRMHLDVPSLPAASAYGFTIPLGCGFSGFNDSSPMLDISYEPHCEGASYSMFIIGDDTTGAYYGLDAGTSVLAAGTTRTVTGSYTALPAYTVDVSSLPAQSIAVYFTAGAFDASNGFADFTPIQTAVPVNDAASFTIHVPSDIDMFELDAVAPVASAYTSQSRYLAQVAFAPTTAFDASVLLPDFSGMMLPPSADAASWSFIGTTPSTPAITGFDAFIDRAEPLHWTVYAPGTVTGVTFPALPADLAGAFTTGGTWNLATTGIVAAPDATYSSLLKAWDSAWLGSDGGWLFPYTVGLAYDWINYDAGLGPP
jgi:hypothetical protein